MTPKQAFLSIKNRISQSSTKLLVAAATIAVLVVLAVFITTIISSNSNKEIHVQKGSSSSSSSSSSFSTNNNNNKNQLLHNKHHQEEHKTLGTQTLEHCHTGMIRYNRKFLMGASSSSWNSPKRGAVLLSGMTSIQDLAKTLMMETTIGGDGVFKNQNNKQQELLTLLNSETNFQNIFDIDYQEAKLKIPPHLKQKASAMFADYKKAQITQKSQKIEQQQQQQQQQQQKDGAVLEDPDDVAHIETQHVVVSTNKVTNEMSLFNELRKYRPGAMRHITPEEDEQINAKFLEKVGEDKCDFCSRNKTAVDVFGRIIGEHCFTASNIAKMSKWHSLIINNNHHPLRVSREEAMDWIHVARKWFAKAHEIDPLARYPHLIYDAGARASASQPHLHLHLMLTRNFYFTHAKNLLDRAYQYSYCENGGLRDYWRDWIRSHEAVGLALHHDGSWLIVSLTPVHDKEIFVIGNSDSKSFGVLFHFAINLFVNSKLQVRAFSMGMFFETMMMGGGDKSFTSSSSSSFYPTEQRMPAVARFIDRGAPFDMRNDAGAMEFYGAFNVGTDPYFIMEQVQELAKKEGLV